MTETRWQSLNAAWEVPLWVFALEIGLIGWPVLAGLICDCHFGLFLTLAATAVAGALTGDAVRYVRRRRQVTR